MSKNMLIVWRQERMLILSCLEVISDWRLLTFCSVLSLRNTVLMFQKNLQTCFDVACSRRSHRKRKTNPESKTVMDSLTWGENWSSLLQFV